MRSKYIAVRGTEQGIDFDAHYCIGKDGIAYYLRGWAVEYVQTTYLGEDEDGNEIKIDSGEYEEEADYEYVVAVMVGDDRHHRVHISDLQVIDDEAFCRDCGQIGCGCNVYA